MVPERQAREDDFFEVVENFFERLAMFGRADRQKAFDVAGLDGGKNGIIARAIQIFSDPIGVGVSGAAKVIRENVRKRHLDLGSHAGIG